MSVPSFKWPKISPFQWWFFFHTGNMLILIQYHKLQESVHSIMHFCWFEIFLLSVLHIPLQNRKPWLQLEATHTRFILELWFLVLQRLIWTWKMFEDLEISICCFHPSQFNSQTPWRGCGSGWRSVFSFSYIFIYFSHRASHCNIMFIHGIA